MSCFGQYTIIVCVFLGLSLGGCKTKKEEPDLIRSVKTITVTSTLAGSTRQLSGVLKPTDESDISFQVGGTVDSVEVKLGDSVKKDQLLAVMDPRDYELKLQSAQAALSSAKADLATAAEEEKRQKTLQEKNYASKSTYEKAKSQYESAVSKEKIEISRVEEATRDLDRTKLKAPFEGKISLRAIEPHQETQTGKMVFKLQSAEGLKAEVLVPESLIRGMAPKQPVTLEFPTMKNLKVPGTVREIGAQSDTGNAFPVRIDLSETKADLRAGMSVQILFNELKEGPSSVYLIPLTAIDTRPKENKPRDSDKDVSVFLFDKETSTVKSHDVNAGGIQGNLIEVTQGLKEGDLLVTAGVPFLEDNQKVTQWKSKYRSPETDQ